MSRSRTQRQWNGTLTPVKTAGGKAIVAKYGGRGSVREEARWKKGAKKFLRSRRRFHEKNELRDGCF